MAVKMISSPIKKFIAVIEVIFVRFVLFPLLFLALTRRLPGFQTWQTDSLLMPFPVTGHILMVVVSFFVLLISKRKFSTHGIRFQPIKYHLDITGACFFPVVLANIPFGLGINYQDWPGALILAAVQVMLLFVIGWTLRTKPESAMLGLVFFPLAWLFGRFNDQLVGKAFAELITYAVFVGFGEEIIFRGYMQSRLNDAFGRPFQFFGIKYGWGLWITSFLFGFSHVGVTNFLLTGQNNLFWAWGFWTFFGGLVFGLIREKSNSIFAPALLHGLPQAIASAVMVWFP